MSAAKPYPTDWREQGWGEIWQMTPRQSHRTVKKMRRMGDDSPWKPAASYAGQGAKNRPTPRRDGEPHRDARRRWCPECDGTGLVEVNGRGPRFGVDPCPNGCWNWIHTQAATLEARTA